jgi:hypothetical protein
MKKFYLFVFLVSFSGALFAQLPGGNFEHWKTATFEFPTAADWTVYHEQLDPHGAGLLEKTTDASDGEYAIKFNTYGTRDFGYVVYGQIGEDGPSGGIPFADNPTQFTISYKCSLAEGDTAQVWVWLFSNGVQITSDIFKFYGDQSEYTDATFDLSSYTASPDSMMFALVPDDPFVEKTRTSGNYVCFDNARFVGGDNNLQLTDNSFEDWTARVLEYTSEMFEIEALVEKSDDAYDGMYALKMSTQNSGWYEDDEHPEDNQVYFDGRLFLWGARTGIQVGEDDWEERYLGGIGIPARKDTLIFYYKYMHPKQVVDTANVGITFEKDSIRVYDIYSDLLQTDTWTEHRVPFDLDHAWGDSVLVVDSMILELESTSWRETWTVADTNVEGSMLYVDYMYLASQAAYLGVADEDHLGNLIRIFPNPSYDVLYIRGLTTVKDLEIISVNGALLYRDNISGDTSIDISDYPAGVYLIRMDRKLMGKIIKQ